MCYIFFELLRFPVNFIFFWIYFDLISFYCGKVFSVKNSPRDRFVWGISSILFTIYFCTALYLFPAEPKYTYSFLCITFMYCILSAKILVHQPIKNILIPTLIFIITYVVSIFFPLFFITLANTIMPGLLTSTSIVSKLTTVYEVLFTVLSYNYLPTLILVFLAKFIKKYKKSFESFTLYINYFELAFLSLFIFGILYTYVVLIHFEILKYIEIFYFLFFVLFSLSFFLVIEYKNRRQVISKDREELFKYSITLGDIYEKTEKNREDHSLYLSKLGAYLRDRKYQESEKYLSDILISEKKMNKQNKVLKMLPIKGLKGLLYIKLQEMEEQNLSVGLILSENFDHFDYTRLNKTFSNDICKILGIIIDNALEAALLSENKEILIEIYDEEEALELNITNSFSGTINIHKIFTPGYSTKEYGRGYGLVLVNKIVESHSSLILTTTALDHQYFTQSCRFNHPLYE